MLMLVSWPMAFRRLRLATFRTSCYFYAGQARPVGSSTCADEKAPYGNENFQDNNDGDIVGTYTNTKFIDDGFLVRDLPEEPKFLTATTPISRKPSLRPSTTKGTSPA
jgi:hypothetical protein